MSCLKYCALVDADLCKEVLDGPCDGRRLLKEYTQPLYLGVVRYPTHPAVAGWFPPAGAR